MNKYRLSTTAINFGFRGWSLYKGLILLVKLAMKAYKFSQFD